MAPRLTIDWWLTFIERDSHPLYVTPLLGRTVRPLLGDFGGLPGEISRALIGHQKKHKILVAGDLNILYRHGEGGSLYWKGRYDTVFDRMSALGFRFVGPQAPSGGEQASPWPSELPVGSCNVPTYRTKQSQPETAKRQLDFVFASESIADRISVRAANSIDKWGPSDHCRVFIELK